MKELIGVILTVVGVLMIAGALAYAFTGHFHVPLHADEFDAILTVFAVEVVGYLVACVGIIIKEDA